MTEDQQQQLLEAWRATTAAVAQLRAVLVAAGLELPEAPATPAESVDDRRRRLARERARKARARHARGVTERDAAEPVSRSSVTPSRKSVTPSVTKRDVVTPKRDAVASPARAFLIEEINSPPVFRETLSGFSTDTHPHGVERDAAERDAVTHPGADQREANPGADRDSGNDQPTADGQERPALRAGSTIDPSPVSDTDPGVDRAPESKHGRRPVPTLLPTVPELPDGVAVVWSAYLEAIKPARAKLTAPRHALIARRLREYTVDELVRAVRGYGRSEWHKGDNDRGRPYVALELWLRDAAHVEAGWQLEAGEAKPAKRAGKKAGPALFSGIEEEWQAIEQQRAQETERDIFAELSA